MNKSRSHRRLTVDEAVIAVMIAAMEANQHVSPEEAARAQHIVRSMRRFRRKSGEAVDRLTATVRERVAMEGTASVLEAAVRTLPARLRPPVFAVAVDLMLADAKLEPAERRFVTRLATALDVPGPVADSIVKVMLVKNAA
jgi:tellurite resistance protein